MSSNNRLENSGDTGGALAGCGVIILILLLGSCIFSGGDEVSAEKAKNSDITVPSATTEPSIDSSKVSSSPTEAERLALVDTDPAMKQASDFLGFLINSNGHLCAKVSNVEQVTGSSYRVTCVEYRSGDGRVQYIVDGATNAVTPL